MRMFYMIKQILMRYGHLEAALEKLLSDPAKVASMGGAALNYYVNHATAAHMVSGLMNALHKD